MTSSAVAGKSGPVARSLKSSNRGEPGGDLCVLQLIALGRIGLQGH